MYDDYKYKNKLDRICFEYLMPIFGIVAVSSLFVLIILTYSG